MLNKKLDIAFIHPDLGIGGAERLVVDAAVGLQEQGHNVVIYTSHCDKSHCFEEVKSGLLKVEVFGDNLPTTIKGKGYIICSNLRQLYLTAQLVISGKIQKHDLFIVDQLSTCVPFLHMLGDGKILFYCHFPDQLLAIREGLLKKLYRVPFDYLEQFTMGSSDTVVVNSNFTKTIYDKTFPWISKEPHVIYPCVNTESKQKIDDVDKQLLSNITKPNDIFYLSINRYEKKKNISLALAAFAKSKAFEDKNSKLFICGGYDNRVEENIECLEELQKEATELKLSHQTIFYNKYVNNDCKLDLDVQNSKVIFLTSISGSLKELLLSKTELLLYTPTNEHFGIVPLEAMNNGKPVLAVNNGGPLETVESLIIGQNNLLATGWLRKSEAADWADAINEYIKISNSDAAEYSDINFERAGPLRVEKKFSRIAMTKSFENNIDRIYWTSKYKYVWENLIIILANALLQSFISITIPNNGIPHIMVSFWISYYFQSVSWAIMWLAAGLVIQFGDQFL